MNQYFPALSWAATGMILLIYFGSQNLALGDRSGLYYIAASPLVGAVLFALRYWLQRPAERREAYAADGDPAITDVNDAAAGGPTKLGSVSEVARRAWRWKLIAAAMILISMPLCSWLVEFQVRTETMWYVVAIANWLTYSLAATMWCYFDSVQFGLRIHQGYRVLVFLLPALGFPVYALKTRGARGLSLILAGALFMMLTFALTKSVSMITEYYLPSV